MTTTLSSSLVRLLRLVALIGLPLSFAVPALAQQNGGQDAVYNSQGVCGSSCVPSPAFVDASQFASVPTNPDFCSVLGYVLNPHNGVLPSSTGVIDARGLPNTGVNMTCQASPWAGITSPPKATILLPAGTITIKTFWVIPPNTHVIGQGDNLPTAQGVSSGTTIVAASSSVSPMIAFCSSVCTGVAIEKLVLNGNGLQIIGIENSYAGSLSYVDHVGLYQILGTGLLINNAAATGSGRGASMAPHNLEARANIATRGTGQFLKFRTGFYDTGQYPFSETSSSQTS
jgi:hypothetical protein